MASLRDIRTRIASVKNTQQVTRAMKMVAAAKLRKAQEAMFNSRPYAYKIRELVEQLRGKVDPEESGIPPARTDVKRALVVIVTADRGLAGAFNTNVLKSAEHLIGGEFADLRESGGLDLLCIGRKGHEHFAKRGYNLVGDYRGFFNDLKFGKSSEVVETLIDGYIDETWDKIVVVYNEFRNTIAQNRIVEPFLPVPEYFQTPVMEGSDDYRQPEDGGKDLDYIFEPDASAMAWPLLIKYLNFQMWRILLESNASEQGARMVAMDNATTNAGELLRDLQLHYNQARQAAITTEILEISSGAEALSQG
jgi:F-type H+-transporting ATPase subunit gamma